MARISRIPSESGIYHIVSRGIDRRNVFLDDEDKHSFLHCLETTKNNHPFDLYAYCLMSNHFHLLIKEVSEPIGQTMRRILCKYVYHHNEKHLREGPLFKDRFSSQPIDDLAYFLNTLSYIHNNPIKAQIVSQIEDYGLFTSHFAYTHPTKHSIVDISFPMSLIGNPLDYQALIGKTIDPDHLTSLEKLDREPDPKSPTIPPSLLQQIIKDQYQIESLTNLPRELRIDIANFAHDNGASIRQIAQLLQISKSQIQRYIKTNKESPV